MTFLLGAGLFTTFMMAFRISYGNHACVCMAPAPKNFDSCLSQLFDRIAELVTRIASQTWHTRFIFLALALHSEVTARHIHLISAG